LDKILTAGCSIKSISEIPAGHLRPADDWPALTGVNGVMFIVNAWAASPYGAQQLQGWLALTALWGRHGAEEVREALAHGTS